MILAYNRLSKYKSLAVVNNAEVVAQRKRQEEQEVFIIPELPRGRLLKIYILSTWGDRYYVGLNGIEIFGDNGGIVNVSSVSYSSIIEVRTEFINTEARKAKFKTLYFKIQYTSLLAISRVS